MSKTFTFKNKVWKDPVSSGWFFVDIDNIVSRKIKELPDKNVSKLGLVKAVATIGNTSWKTTLFPTKQGNYVISVIKTVRKKEKIEDRDIMEVKIEIT